ncbi:hypothetical protein Tco_0283105 [Tanacetum coccineum]
MFLNVDQLEKKLDKEEFQEIGSMAAFRVLETQFQKFIKPRISLNDENGIMTHKYFLEYTKIEVRQFRDTLIQHMEFVNKSIYERALHKREYDTRVNERYIYKPSIMNDTDADDADIRPIYDEEPMAEIAKKKTQERGRNSRPSVMPFAIPQSTANEDLTFLAGNPVNEILPKLNLPDHRYKRWCCSLIPAESVSLPHAHI